MREQFRRFIFALSGLFRSYKFFRISTLVSLLFIILVIGLIFWKIFPLRAKETFLPLHYNIYLGIDLLGPWYRAFVLPAMGLTLIIINVIFETVFVEKERMLSYFFAVGTLVATAIIFAAMLFVVILNT